MKEAVLKQDIMVQISEHFKFILDVSSISTAILVFFTTVLPPLAAGASLVWSLIRIYETKTIQKLIKRNKYGD